MLGGPSARRWLTRVPARAANGVEYGLSGSVYTRDVRSIFHFVDQVDVGIAHVNQPTLGGEVHLPFGGVKASGIGPHEQGREAIDFFTRVKTVCINHGSHRRPRRRRGRRPKGGERRRRRPVPSACTALVHGRPRRSAAIRGGVAGDAPGRDESCPSHAWRSRASRHRAGTRAEGRGTGSG